jgi:serine/threonine-protein phosphatase 5
MLTSTLKAWIELACAFCACAAASTCSAALVPAAKHYQAAVDGYSKAIDLRPDSPIYYSNRAFAHIKLEEYGSAVADATQSIDLDPTYSKVIVGCAAPLAALAGLHVTAAGDARAAARAAPSLL